MPQIPISLSERSLVRPLKPWGHFLWVAPLQSFGVELVKMSAVALLADLHWTSVESDKPIILESFVHKFEHQKTVIGPAL
jgi:hypothetical protein